MLDKVSLNQKIQDFIAANPSVQGMNQTQLISCLVENEIVTLDELQELSIFASNQDYESVGLTLQSTKTVSDVIKKGKSSEILFKSSDGKTYNLNKTIQNKINKLNKDLEKAEDSNGWIGKAWSWTKNVTGLGAGSDKIRDKQAHVQELLKQFTMDNPKKAEIFKELTGVDFTPEALEAFIKGELKLESEKALDGYKEGQEMATDIAADIGSGITAFVIYGVAVAAAPFTAGASIAVGVAAAATTGAVVKSGIKALDCVGNNKEYTTKDLAYDMGTGAVSGLLAPVSAGAGGAIGKTVATKCGMQVVKSAGKSATEEVVITGFKQTVKHSMLNPGSYKYVGGSMLQKTGVYGAEIAVDAGGSGALDGAFRAEVNGNDVLEGAVTGFGAGIFMGGAFKGIGGAWKGIKKAVKEEPTTKIPENNQINQIKQSDEDIPVVALQDKKMYFVSEIENAQTVVELDNIRVTLRQNINKDNQRELSPLVKAIDAKINFLNLEKLIDDNMLSKDLLADCYDVNLSLKPQTVRHRLKYVELLVEANRINKPDDCIEFRRKLGSIIKNDLNKEQKNKLYELLDKKEAELDAFIKFISNEDGTINPEKLRLFREKPYDDKNTELLQDRLDNVQTKADCEYLERHVRLVCHMNAKERSLLLNMIREKRAELPDDESNFLLDSKFGYNHPNDVNCGAFDHVEVKFLEYENWNYLFDELQYAINLCTKNFTNTNIHSLEDTSLRGRNIVTMPSLFIEAKAKGMKCVIDLRSDVGITSLEQHGYKLIEQPDGTKIIRHNNDTDVSGLNDVEYFVFPVNHDRIGNAGVDMQTIKFLGQFLTRMEAGNLYIGCSNGLHRTDFALALNYALNKNAKNIPQFKDSKVSDLHAAVRRIYDTINAIKKDNPPETWKDFGLDKETLDKIPDADEFEKRLNRLPLV